MLCIEKLDEKTEHALCCAYGEVGYCARTNTPILKDIIELVSMTLDIPLVCKTPKEVYELMTEYFQEYNKLLQRNNK